MRTTLVLRVVAILAIITAATLLTLGTLFLFHRNAVGFLLGVLLQMTAHAVDILDAEAGGEHRNFHLITQFGIEGQAPLQFKVFTKLQHEIVDIVHFVHGESGILLALAGEGEGRVRKAIEDALNSPLLNENDVFNSKKILLSISFAGSKDGQTSLMMEEMNDVNDFMAKFGNDFEIKWGLATDLELGKKVKVTILATGFGIENVDGMNTHLKKQSQEDLNRIAAEQEKAAERQDRRNRYYGGEGTTRRYKRRPNIYLFRPEDLDNDDVISAVESTPTYKRTREILDSINSQAGGEDTTEANDAPVAAPDPVQGTIKFFS